MIIPQLTLWKLDFMGTTSFTPYSIIAKKRNGKKLTAEEIKWFIQGLTKGEIADYQMTALLMAIYLKGFDTEETAALTDAMLYSGSVLDFKDKTVVDKHSTGGIGDKTSFILAPLAAACGVKVPMIAGRGLGHTGGTVDKIEAIKGFKTSLSLEEFSKLLTKRGLVLIGQTPEIAPADKKIYALRDVTATVDNIPLITASIMSKKLAEGAAGIVMDVKCGSGAFMKNKKDAKALAISLQKTAHRFKKKFLGFITNMDQPLGEAVGNTLEIIESIEVLKNRGPNDITDLSVLLAGGMVYTAGLAKSLDDGVKKVRTVLENGEGLKKFKELIENQGGDSGVVDNYAMMPQAHYRTIVTAPKSGYIKTLDCERIGMMCLDLGGGRKKATDIIDFGVGLLIHKKIGDKVNKGDVIATLVHHEKQVELATTLANEYRTKVATYASKKVTAPKLVLEKMITKGK